MERSGAARDAAHDITGYCGACPSACQSLRVNSSHTSSRMPSSAYEMRCDWSSRSEEHTSELQSHSHLVCRLLLEKNNTQLHCKTFDRFCCLGNSRRGPFPQFVRNELSFF